MTQEQLDVIVARTGHERYRWLTSSANPDEWQREAYRKIVADRANGDWPKPVEYPPIIEQVGNALEAVGKFVAAWWLATRLPSTRKRLRDGWRSVWNRPEFDHKQKRCAQCVVQLREVSRQSGNSSNCPINPPKW